MRSPLTPVAKQDRDFVDTYRESRPLSLALKIYS